MLMIETENCIIVDQMSLKNVNFRTRHKKGWSEPAVKPNEKIASPTTRWRTRPTSATTRRPHPQYLSLPSTDYVL